MNLQDYYVGQGEADLANAPTVCPTCQVADFPFALTVTSTDPLTFECGACLIDAARAAQGPYVLTWDDIRDVRDRLISGTDWMVLPDAPVDPDLLASIKDYRTALRNIPQSFDTPLDVMWPTRPG